MKNLILLGAGASHGSQLENSPPLGVGLFKEIEKKREELSIIPRSIKEIFYEDFEKGMVALYDFSPKLAQVLQLAMAGYLAGFIPNRKNLYLKLLSNVKLRKTIFCTLNYDLLIEESGVALGKTVGYFSNSKEQVKIIKPHGSSNFWPNTFGTTFVNCSIHSNSRDGVDFKGPVEAVSSYESISRSKSNSGLCPAMAFYAPGKSVKWCRDYVHQHQKDWEKTALKAKKIFISGVQINKLDTHIWDVVASTRADVYFYGDKNAKASFDEWKREVGKDNLYYLEGWFDFAVADIARKIKG
ncbi:hypothetical protein [Vreelandella sp.]|uniref:hypothetical protein n=1 Tax=Vreelandella sp. TaxID=3137778 RepID=UPI003BA876ED